MAGERLADLGLPEYPSVPGVAVKEAVLPFNRFDVDTILGPEMRSTGEAMGFDLTLGMAYAKAQASAGNHLPKDGGTLVVTVNDRDKAAVLPFMREFHELGFRIRATQGTHAHLEAAGIPSEPIFKINEGRPDIGDAIVSGEVDLLVNTPLGRKSQFDDYAMRRAAIAFKVPYLTTLSATAAASQGIRALRDDPPMVRSLQEWDALRAAGSAGGAGAPPEG
jgi:carbamoyl-phosphate synthase large subunit